MSYTTHCIEICNVSKEFYTHGEKIAAVKNINLTIGDGEFFCIVGPSGCGKTTLLRILAGLESASSGTINLKQPSNGRPSNSMVFQEQSIFPWMTIQEKQNNAWGIL